MTAKATKTNALHDLSAKAGDASRSVLLPIDESFQQTIQGEGYWAGTPCDFIRLSGCPVGCHFCDTGYSITKKKPFSLVSISDLISSLKSDRVVITGGEPCLHPSLSALVDEILDSGRNVSIETSGAFPISVSDRAWVTVSPKMHISPKYPVLESAWNRASEIKIVIQAGDELAYYQDRFSFENKLCYLQPEWNSFQESLQKTLILLQSSQKMRLSLQSHKFIGLR